VASTTSAIEVLAGVIGELVADKESLETFRRAMRGFVDEAHRGLEEGISQLSAELNAAHDAVRRAIEAADRDSIESDLPSSEALARLEDKIVVRFNDVDARLDDVEAVMEEPLPVDVSGILRVLESKLFVPLDEMADSLAASQGGEIAKTLSDVAVRLDEAVAAIERRTAAPNQDGDPNHQRQLLERIDEMAQQMEALRRRIALRARPGSGQLDADSISAIAEAVAARLSAKRPAAPNRSAPTPRPPGERTVRVSDDALKHDDGGKLEATGGPTLRTIRLR
jgi:hypothetical protein